MNERFYVIRVANGLDNRSVFAHDERIAQDLANRCNARNNLARYHIEPEATCTASALPLPKLEGQYVTG